jgi:protein-S-isoprenylcysteine O-methyltransferase Ste14
MPGHLRLAAGTAAATAFTSKVIGRMQDEYVSTGTLSPSTVALMYSAYGATLWAFASAARCHALPVPLPRRPARSLGGALTAAGAALAVAGAGRFDSAAQVSGIEPGQLVTAGVYRHTRNPQYLGIVVALAGLAIATRSGLAAIVAASGWRAFDRWIPCEERHLQRIFGERYRSYADQTWRWL